MHAHTNGFDPVRFFLTVVWLTGLAVGPGAATGATITVDTDDGGPVSLDGNCSLAEALVSSNFNVPIDACNGGTSGQDTIAFDVGLFSGAPFFSATISLAQSLDIADGGVVIEPPSGRTLIIGAAGSNRVFTISAGDSLFRRVTLTGGSTTGDGGAILINAPADDASLQLEEVFGNNNTADGIGGFIGGNVDTGIFNLNVFSSSFSSNTSNGFSTFDDIAGGVIGIDVPRSFGFLNVLIDDSTFSGNNATNSHGGAVALYTSALEGANFGLTITNSVFSENDADEAGGAIYLDEERSQNGYSATIRNNRFSMNAAGRAGAIFAGHAPVSGASSDQLLLDRNTFIGNDGPVRAGAVEVVFIDTVIRNNLFAQNTSGTTSSGNAGALHIDHDGGAGTTISNGGVEIRANTFFENVGNPDELLLDMPLTGQGAAGPSRIEANIVQSMTGTGPTCEINNGPNGDWNVSNLPFNECTVGGASVFAPGLALGLMAVNHPVHSMAAIPPSSSPAVDLWPEFNCTDVLGGGPLNTDLLGERRDAVSGLPPDGDGDGNNDCDAGSIELEQQFALDVSLQGSGSGSVDSDPVGIDCPGSCMAAFPDGALVELFATPDVDNSFEGWGGACSGTGGCVVEMDQARSVSATFEPLGQRLVVQLLGNGTGSVSSSPAGINCPGDCEEDFPAGTAVTLTATADGGSEFLNWNGDCSGNGGCSLTMDQPRSVGAVFGNGDLLFLDGFE
jgi:hypothetical protein